MQIIKDLSQISLDPLMTQFGVLHLELFLECLHQKKYQKVLLLGYYRILQLWIPLLFLPVSEKFWGSSHLLFNLTKRNFWVSLVLDLSLSRAYWKAVLAWSIIRMTSKEFSNHELWNQGQTQNSRWDSMLGSIHFFKRFASFKNYA